jgi:hypothetical protein
MTALSPCSRSGHKDSQMQCAVWNAVGTSQGKVPVFLQRTKRMVEWRYSVRVGNHSTQPTFGQDCGSIWGACSHASTPAHLLASPSSFPPTLRFANTTRGSHHAACIYHGTPAQPPHSQAVTSTLPFQSALSFRATLICPHNNIDVPSGSPVVSYIWHVPGKYWVA